MVKSKIYLVLILFINPLGFTYSQVSKSKDYILTITKGRVEKIDKNTYWIIPTTFTNQSKDTLKYFSMSCSWSDFYTVDNRKLQVRGNDCDKNIPIILTLAPNACKTVEVYLQISQTMDASSISFRIGMHLVKAGKSTDNYNYFGEKENKKDIIWSNAIEM